MSFVSGSVKINYMHLSLLICVSNVCREGTHNFCSSARVAKHATGNTAWEQLTGSVWFLSLSLPNTPCKKPCVFLCILQHPDKVIHILHSKHILITLILAQVHGSSSFGIEQRSGQNVCLVVGWGSPCNPFMHLQESGQHLKPHTVWLFIMFLHVLSNVVMLLRTICYHS